MTSNPERTALYAEVGRRIRAARRSAHRTQTQLATSIALSRTTVTNIEQGRQQLLVHTLCDIARALDVSVQMLLPTTTVPTDTQDVHIEAKPSPDTALVNAFIESAEGASGQRKRMTKKERSKESKKERR